jgi:hypothetical protein
MHCNAKAKVSFEGQWGQRLTRLQSVSRPPIEMTAAILAAPSTPNASNHTIVQPNRLMGICLHHTKHKFQGSGAAWFPQSCWSSSTLLSTESWEKQETRDNLFDQPNGPLLYCPLNVKWQKSGRRKQRGALLSRTCLSKGFILQYHNSKKKKTF